MLQTIINWWNRDKIAVQQQLRSLSTQIEQERTARQHANLVNQELEERLSAANEEVGVFRQQAAEDEAKRNGTDPWVEIKSESVDPVKGIQIELDWNPAFIQYLKEAGIKARDEETIVQKWLAFLYQDLIEKLEKQVVDNSDKPRVNDFE
jgi:hypothetical protein